MENLEQPEYDVDSASSTDENKGDNSLTQVGEPEREHAESSPNQTRFKTLEDCEKAYDEMRSAFTRKTQELARIKKVQNGCELKEGKAAGDVNQTSAEKAEGAAPHIQVSNPEAEVKQSSKGEAVRNEIIEEYLRNVASRVVPPVIANPTNDFAFTNLGDARTINQVEKVVANFFKTKGTKE